MLQKVRVRLVKVFKSRLFFYPVMLILLLLFFEAILSISGYFYFYVYSNLESPKIEEDAFRILFLGESTTAGYTIEEEGNFSQMESVRKSAYPTQVEEILQQKYPNKRIRCYNKGLGAIETTGILRNLDENMIKYKPHLVVLMAGWNDKVVTEKDLRLKKLYNLKIYRFIALVKDILLPIFRPGGGLRELWIIKSRSGFRWLGLEKLWGDYRYIAPVHEPKSFSQYVLNFNSIIQTVHSYGSEVWFVGYLQPDARKRVNPVLKEVAEKNNIVYIEDYPELDFEVNRSLFAWDDWHPSKEGHRIIAEKIVKTIIKEKNNRLISNQND